MGAGSRRARQNAEPRSSAPLLGRQREEGETHCAVDALEVAAPHTVDRARTETGGVTSH